MTASAVVSDCIEEPPPGCKARFDGLSLLLLTLRQENLSCLVASTREQKLVCCIAQRLPRRSNFILQSSDLCGVVSCEMPLACCPAAKQSSSFLFCRVFRGNGVSSTPWGLMECFPPVDSSTPPGPMESFNSSGLRPGAWTSRPWLSQLSLRMFSCIEKNK